MVCGWLTDTHSHSLSKDYLLYVCMYVAKPNTHAHELNWAWKHRFDLKVFFSFFQFFNNCNWFLLVYSLCYICGAILSFSSLSLMWMFQYKNCYFFFYYLFVEFLWLVLCSEYVVWNGVVQQLLATDWQHVCLG